MTASARRLLVVTRHCPLPENDGAGAYLFDLLRYLAQRQMQIHLAWLQPDSSLFRRGWWLVPDHVAAVAHLHLPGAWAVGRLRIFPNIWWLPFKARFLHRSKRLLQAFGFLRHRRAPAPSASGSKLTPGEQWHALPTATETIFFKRVVQRVQPDAVLANYCWLTPLFSFAPGARKLVLTHDVASHRLSMTGAGRLDTASDLNPATAVGETALLGRADAILAISDDDAAVFSQMHPAKPILVVPKSAAIDRSASPSVPGRCLFVGGHNAPNQQGLRWFVDHVWPAVRAAVPAAELHVCGAVGEALQTPPPAGVVIRGRIDDLTSEYRAAEVAIVPLLRGTGVKIKLVEAAAHGKACVTTSAGLQGLPFFREAVLIADSEDAFQHQLIRLLGNAALRTCLSERVQCAAEAHLSPETCFSSVHFWLQASTERALAPAFQTALA